MSSWPPEFIANGKSVCLEMSRLDHANDLMEVVAKGQLHKMWYTMIPEPDGISDEIHNTFQNNINDRNYKVPFIRRRGGGA